MSKDEKFPGTPIKFGNSVNGRRNFTSLLELSNRNLLQVSAAKVGEE